MALLMATSIKWKALSLKKKIVDRIITSSYDLVFGFTINHLVIDDVYNCIHSGFDFRAQISNLF